jgi:Zn-dependent peptidase ImmA (M78 family)
VLDRISRELDLRPEFFAVGRPLARIDSVNAHFRSLRSARVSDRQKALATATLLWELTFALERFVQLPEPNLPALPAGATPSEAATFLRSHWHLPDGPVRHLVATAESHGIVIAVRPLGEIGAVDAFSTVIVDRPIIVTTPRRTENVFRHRFSIAHEIGHLLMHSEAATHDATAEREADEFAAAFLTPGPAMDTALPARLDLAALDRIGRQWGVSPHSLVRRMVERGRTTDSSARRAFQKLQTTTDPSADPASAYPGETPTLLKKAADLAADHGGRTPVIADAMKMSTSRMRDLLGEEDKRPVLRLVDDA